MYGRNTFGEVVYDCIKCSMWLTVVRSKYQIQGKIGLIEYPSAATGFVTFGLNHCRLLNGKGLNWVQMPDRRIMVPAHADVIFQPESNRIIVDYFNKEHEIVVVTFLKIQPQAYKA